ncbi:MAG: hypothetical protein ACYTXT_45110, partial [Nostoc sp.]
GWILECVLMINPASVIPPTLSSVFIDELLLKALRLVAVKSHTQNLFAIGSKQMRLNQKQVE